MGKTYNTRLIKDNYSYYIEQIADMFDIDAATVRRWIRKEGLQRLPNTRPHLVHSSDLKAFFEKRQAKQKSPCKPNEIFCFSCQSPRTPKIGSVVAEQCANKSTRLKAKCSACGKKMNKSIKAHEWSKKHPLATYLYDASDEHKGVISTHRECPVQGELAL